MQTMSANDDIAFLFGLHGVDLREGTSKEAPSEERSSGMQDEAVSSGCKDAGGELAAFLERHRVETAAPRGDGIASTHPVGGPPARRAETAAQRDDKGCEALEQHGREDMHAGDLPWYERLGLVPARPQKASRKTSSATRGAPHWHVVARSTPNRNLRSLILEHSLALNESHSQGIDLAQVQVVAVGCPG